MAAPAQSKAAERGPELAEETAAVAAATSARSPRSALIAKWVIGLLIPLLATGVGAYAYHKSRQAAPAEAASAEVSLGEFRFQAESGQQGKIASAAFSLHVALVDGAKGDAGRQRLEARRYRIQQDIEELLRSAHSGDFEDPRLRELKRQILVQVNDTLAMPAVAEVVITNLKLQPARQSAASADAALHKDSESGSRPDSPGNPAVADAR